MATDMNDQHGAETSPEAAGGSVAPAQGGEFIELIERQVLLSWHEAASRLDLDGYDWRLERIGDALCSVSPTERSFLVNRVLGLGSQAAPTLRQLTDIRELYRAAGISRFFLHVMPEIVTREVEQLLIAAGYRRHRGWMKFTRGPATARRVQADLSVRRIRPGEAAGFASIAGPAFGLDDASRPTIAALADDPHWHLYMSFDGTRPAGTGAFYRRGDIAYLDWGATHPDFRRRGSQTALLGKRIRDAVDAGCRTIVTMTGEAVPGEPQHSYGNILKAGFSEAYLRANWVPADS